MSLRSVNVRHCQTIVRGMSASHNFGTCLSRDSHSLGTQSLYSDDNRITRHRMNRLKLAFCATIAALWLGGSIAGMDVLRRYHLAPGTSAQAPRRWPRNSRVPHTAGVPSLVMFAHPRCPCTAASIDELSRLRGRARSELAISVVFVKPATVNQAIDDNVNSAKAIPGAAIIDDEDGSEAARFGALTSGHVLLYDSAGNLLYNGGITASRGHRGDSAGQTAILSMLNGRAPQAGQLPLSQAPVFGCALPKRRRLS
jgi:hypothetical protein